MTLGTKSTSGSGVGRLLVALAVCIAAVLVAVLPAAANNKPTTGARISLTAPPATFPANSPFHIEHGFTCDLGDGSCLGDQISANGDFDLYLDDVLQPSNVDVNRLDGGVIGKFRLTNYSSGLPAGTHTFVGVNTLDGTVVLTRTVTITFV